MFKFLKKIKVSKFLANYRKLAYIYLLLITIVLGLVLNKIIFRVEEPVVAAFKGSPTLAALDSRNNGWLKILLDCFLFDADNCEKLLEQGLPLVNFYVGANRNQKQIEKKIYELIFSFITNIDFNNPRTYFHNQIPLVAKLDYPVLSRYQEREPAYTLREQAFLNDDEHNSVISGEGEEQNKLSIPGFAGNVLVGIYHSHNSETFIEIPGPRGDHHLEGQNADIVEVGEELANYLQKKYKIGVAHSKTIHDYPIQRQAYQKSVITAGQILKSHSKINILLDIHRDAQSREITTAEIGGKKVAKIMILVGTERLGLAHPNWEKNYELARKLVTRMETKYPGLSRGILIADGRYNQHLSPGALLLEVGAHENTKEEALNSIHLFGDVLAEILAN